MSAASEKRVITTLYDLKSLNIELKAKRGHLVDSNAMCEAFASRDVSSNDVPHPSGWGTGPFVSIDHCAPVIQRVDFDPSESVVRIKVQVRPPEFPYTHNSAPDTFHDGVRVECMPFFGGSAGPVVAKFHEYQSYLRAPSPASVTVDLKEISSFLYSTLILRVSWSVVCAPPGQSPRKRNTCPVTINDGKGTTVVLLDVAAFDDDIGANQITAASAESSLSPRRRRKSVHPCDIPCDMYCCKRARRILN